MAEIFSLGKKEPKFVLSFMLCMHGLYVLSGVKAHGISSFTSESTHSVATPEAYPKSRKKLVLGKICES